MKASTILMRAIFVIVLFAGIPHIVAKVVHSEVDPLREISTVKNVQDDELKGLESAIEEVHNFNPLVGYWYTEYEEMQYGATYEFRVIEDGIEGYLVEMYDVNGEKQDQNVRVMENMTFSDGTGSATYVFEYDGEKAEVECSLALRGETLEVKYEYYGMEVTENWAKVE